MNQKFEKALPIILTSFSCLGVIGTSVLVAQETLKAHEKAKNLESKKEKAKVYLKAYVPAILVGSATIASMIGSTAVSRKIEASLSSAALLANGLLIKYKDKIKRIGSGSIEKIQQSIAEDQSKKINENKITDGKKVYWEEHVGFFETTPLDIEKGINITNERINSVVDENGQYTKFYASLRTFLYDCDAVTIENESEIIDDVSYQYGWSYKYLNETFNDLFLHLTFKECEKDGKKFTIISFDKDPIFDVENWKQWEDYGGYDIKNIGEEDINE